MYEGYKPDFCEIKRNSRDKYVDSRGKELIEMCIAKTSENFKWKITG